jgi:hypothetical protein
MAAKISTFFIVLFSRPFDFLNKLEATLQSGPDAGGEYNTAEELAESVIGNVTEMAAAIRTDRHYGLPNRKLERRSL